MSLPVAALTFLGALITLLGLFAAGNIVVAGVGIAALVAAGVLDLAARRAAALRVAAPTSAGDPSSPDRPGRGRPALRTPLVLLLLGGAVAVALVGIAWGTTATATPPPDPTPTEAPEAPDGAHVGRIVGMSGSPSSFTIDLVELLSGEEAVEAAREDGFLGPDENDLPNDYYLRDPDSETYVAWLSGSATVALYDCTRGCEQVEVGLDDFLAGRERAFNGDHAIYDLTVAGGEVVAIAEIYLP